MNLHPVSKWFSLTVFTLILWTSPVFAVTFSVNSTLDTRDTMVGDGNCEDVAGNCTLRAAVMEANATPGTDAITLAADTYTLRLSSTSDDDIAATGDLDIVESVTISGVDDGSTTINGSGFLDKDGDGHTFRIFQVSTAVTSVTFEDLTITGGDVADSGGGIYSEGKELTLTSTNVTSNQADSSSAKVYGGGIYVKPSAADASVTITSSTIADNSIETDSKAAYGGGIYIAHDSSLITVTISQSTISGNTITADPPYGAGIATDGASVTISESTISGNSTTDLIDTEAGYGGGIQAESNFGTEKIIIKQSTISGNSAAQTGGGIRVSSGVELGLYNVTVAGNYAYNGGGIYYSDSSGVFQNSLFADNTATVSPDCGGTLASGSYNLIEDYDSNSCDISGLTNTMTGDPLLDSLASNGGPSQTRALMAGSPAIDAGDPAGCTDADNTLFTTDQNGSGYTRPVDGDGDGTDTCDIGAYEYQVTCGDCIMAGSEECDDGGTTDNDGCSSSCAEETQYYQDSDGDGYGNSSISQYASSQPADYVTNATDCDDTDASIYPGATEISENGIDEDCNGEDALNSGLDSDGDGVDDTQDAFPADATESSDTDDDGTGNNADTDDNNDGLEDAIDDETDVADGVGAESDSEGNADQAGNALQSSGGGCQLAAVAGHQNPMTSWLLVSMLSLLIMVRLDLRNKIK